MPDDNSQNTQGSASQGSNSQGSGQGAGGQGAQTGAQGSGSASPETFEAWLGALPAEQSAIGKPLFDAHVLKLMNTVKDTREERDAFEKQLRDAAKKLKEGSEERATLDKLSSDLELANARAAFYEEAGSIGCRNPKAAFLIAKDGEMFTRSGKPDWDAIKAAAPELFGEAAPRRPNAGAGTGGSQKETVNVNDWIRHQAGRQ